MCNVLRGVCWDCTVIPIPVHWNITEDLHAYSDTCKHCPIYLVLYTCMNGCAHPDLWSRSNKSLLSVANNLMCMYQSIFCLITQWMNLCCLVFAWFLIHPCTLLLNWSRVQDLCDLEIKGLEAVATWVIWVDLLTCCTSMLLDCCEL